LKKDINIRLKTLYDKRKTFNFKCNIESPISILLDKLTVVEDEKMGNVEGVETVPEPPVLEKAAVEKEKFEKNEMLGKKEKFERFDKNSQYRIISSNVIYFICNKYKKFPSFSIIFFIFFIS
jgi:hypothetical protein